MMFSDSDSLSKEMAACFINDPPLPPIADEINHKACHLKRKREGLAGLMEACRKLGLPTPDNLINKAWPNLVHYSEDERVPSLVQGSSSGIDIF